MDESRLRWFGHVKRMEVGRLQRRMFEMELKEKRLRRRPRGTLIKDIKKGVERKEREW